MTLVIDLNEITGSERSLAPEQRAEVAVLPPADQRYAGSVQKWRSV